MRGPGTRVPFPLLALDLPGQPEVQQLGPPLRRDEDVLRLEVAMDDAPGVGGGQPRSDLLREFQALTRRQPPRPQPCPQVPSLQQLVDRVGTAGMGADVVEDQDVRVAQPGHCAGFDLESAEPSGIGGHGRGKELDRHRPIEAEVAGAVDVAHPAGAEQRLDPVVADDLAGGECGCFRRRQQLRRRLRGGRLDEAARALVGVEHRFHPRAEIGVIRAGLGEERRPAARVARPSLVVEILDLPPALRRHGAGRGLSSA